MNRTAGAMFRAWEPANLHSTPAFQQASRCGATAFALAFRFADTDGPFFAPLAFVPFWACFFFAFAGIPAPRIAIRILLSGAPCARSPATSQAAFLLSPAEEERQPT